MSTEHSGPQPIQASNTRAPGTQGGAGSAPRPAPQWRAFLEMGFRPLYLVGCGYAAVSIALWVFAPGVLRGSLGPVAWHAHEMLWGFVATIAVGFLFTAAGNWTGSNPMHGLALGVLVILWLVARVCFLLPGAPALWIGGACELAFFAWSAAALLRVIHGARNRRNYGVPLLVLVLGAADAGYLHAASLDMHDLLRQFLETGLLAMAVLALLIARRVIPFFAMRAVPGLAVAMHVESGRWQLGAGALAVVFHALQWPAFAAGALAVAGAIAVKQLLDWKPWAVRHQPLLWILYIGYGGLAMGLLVASLRAAGFVARAAWSVHVIGLAGFSLLIIGMVTRTALGHLGRPLRADRPIVAMYGLVLAAAALRLVALLDIAHTVVVLRLAGTAWIAAFALYVGRFLPMMIRPKVDAAAGARAVRT